MIDHAALPDHLLESLAQCLDGQSLPPGAIKLEQVLGRTVALAVHPQIEAMAAAGWTPDQIRALVQAILRERHLAAKQWEWVVSGPAQDGVPTRDTGVIYRALVQEARHSILLSSYALYKGRELMLPLWEQMQAHPALRVRLVLDISRDYGDRSKSEGILYRFVERFRTRDWPWAVLPEVYYDPRALDPEPGRKAVLHAKCVLVDGRRALVTSANLTQAAQERNIEAGVLVTDAHRVTALEQFFAGLIESGVLRRLGLAEG